MNWLKEKNNPDIEYDPKAQWERENNSIELEKKDIFALYISALLVFSPIFLILIGILIWSFRV